MREVAAILLVLTGVLDLAGSFGYLLGGGLVAMLGGMLGIGAGTLHQEMARAGPAPGAEQIGAATGMVAAAGGGIVLFGLFLLFTGILLMVAAVFLFRRKKPRLIAVAAILAIVAELGGAGIAGPGFANAVGILAGIVALAAARRMSRSGDGDVANFPG